MLDLLLSDGATTGAGRAAGPLLVRAVLVFEFAIVPARLTLVPTPPAPATGLAWAEADPFPLGTLVGIVDFEPDGILDSTRGAGALAAMGSVHACSVCVRPSGYHQSRTACTGSETINIIKSPNTAAVSSVTSRVAAYGLMMGRMTCR